MVHTENFVLVDAKKVRGFFYDGTNKGYQKLIIDINFLSNSSNAEKNKRILLV
jgi:protein SCO1/2